MIKFRMWRDDRMQQLHEMHSDEEHEHCFQKSERDGIILRFTGFLDRTDKEIYEGDIIKDHTGLPWECVFLNGCFWMKRETFNTTNLAFSWPEHCYPMFRVDHALYSEVVGNKYANPDLL